MRQDQDTTEVAVVKAEPVELGTLRASSPAGLVAGAEAIAKPLADVIRRQKLSVNIQGREYVKAEGWTTLAAMLGVLPREVSNRRQDDGSYEAVVELVRMSDGAVLVSASAECGTDEPMWMSRPAYARRSMAATRATGKACRLAFSWIVALAGYEATPFEEMDGVVVDARPASPQQQQPADPDAIVIPFGKNKGTPLTDLTDAQLRWYAEDWTPRVVGEDGQPLNPKWVARDAALKTACKDEQARRQKTDAVDVVLTEPTDEIPF